MLKEFKGEEIMKHELLKSKIRMMFNVLRHDISGDEFYVLLLLISIYKDDQISNNIIDEYHELKDVLISKLSNCRYDSSNQYSPVVKCFENTVDKISNSCLSQIFNIFDEIPKQLLTEQFPDLFDSILYLITQNQGKFGSGIIQPDELTRFMCSLAEIKEGAKVFNPFAGLASFGVYFNQGQIYYGQELNNNTWAIGVLRQIAYNSNGFSKYACEDSILNWPNNSNKFDLIISIPPTGLKIHSYNISGKFINTYKRVEQLIVERSIENLSSTGKVITIVPLSFLQKSQGEEHILANLIECDLIEYIISIPGGLLINTGIPLAILVLNKSKKLTDKIKFIDAKNFVIEKSPREKVLNDISLNSFIQSEIEDENFIRIVDKDQIRNNDYNLNVKHYFQKHIDGVKLREIIEFERLQRAGSLENAKLIRIRDLKNDKVEYKIDGALLEETSIREFDNILSNSCLLIARRGENIKPTIFEFNGERIFISPDILSFQVNDSKVDIAYLINELQSDYVKEQLDTIRLGDSMPYFRKNDLLNIIIKLPNLKEQSSIVKEINKAYWESKFKELKLENEIIALKSTFNEELREKQHCIRQHLKNVVDSISVINTFMINRGGLIRSDDVINPNRNMTVAHRFEAMSNSIRSLSFEIDNLTNDEPYDKPELLPIKNIISESIFEFGDTKGFAIQENYDEPSLGEDVDSNPNISLSKRSFKELFNNILMNASIHGFDLPEKTYLIIILVNIENDRLKLSILNNGKPFTEGMSKQLGIKGKKAGKNAGSGIGSWKIFEIAKHYNFDCKIVDLPNDEFPVGWEFTFNIIEKN